MAWDKKQKHISGTVIYSIYELEDWLKRTRRSEDEQKRYARGEAGAGHVMPHGGTDCPVCGWPVGKLGFVRAPAMPNEWAYGKLFACPECWPYPLGKQSAEGANLNEAQDAQLQAARPRVARLK